MRPASVPRARLALVVLTTVWGSTFVVIQSGVDHVSPAVLIASRFALAAVGLFLLRPAALPAALRLILPAMALSLAALGGFLLQTTGLQWTTPARSAFLTSLSVVMVPIVELLLTRQLPRPRLLVAAVTAAFGIWVLFRPLGLEWNLGDTLTVVAAALFAFYIVELGRLCRKHDETALVLAQCLTVAVVAGLLAPWLETPRFVVGVPAIFAVVYLGLICTALLFVLMTWAQRSVPNVEAAVIYTLEPILAAVFSVLLGREPMTAKLAVGGVLVVTAMMIASTGPHGHASPPEGID